jgi:hypothetical protein
MRRFLPVAPIVVVACATAAVLAFAAPAFAQNEDQLRQFFEGQRVRLRVDMPGTQEGVDVWPQNQRPVDYQHYGDLLKRYPVALQAGESSTVTLVKVKKDLIEFQIGGGGFGTFLDDTSTSANIPLMDKTNREKELERAIKDERDSRQRREMQRELDDLRAYRDRENRRIVAERAIVEERKKERVNDQRLHGGSRFNLRYNGSVPNDITPEDVMNALGEFVTFSFSDRPSVIRDLPPDRRPAETMPFRGMTRAEAIRAFGEPVDSSSRYDGRVRVNVLVFIRGDQRITADFVDGEIVSYTIRPR